MEMCEVVCFFLRDATNYAPINGLIPKIMVWKRTFLSKDLQANQPKRWPKKMSVPYPIASIYGILFTYIYHEIQPNVGKYKLPVANR